MNILEFRHIKKSFGSNTVLSDLDFSVGEGKIFGFLGMNGAGKTTAMKTALGFLAADGGEVYVCGEKVTYGNSSSNRCVGYLPDVPEYYNFMTPAEYLLYCGELSGMDGKALASRITDLLTQVGLGGLDAKRKIRGFSRGMKQRLGIAQALIAQPRLLLCDEPTSALDPIGRKEILDLLLAVKGDTTVVLSTHILSDAERVCDEVAVLAGGKIALSGSLDELRAAHRADSLVLEFSSHEDREKFLSLPELGGLEMREEGTLVIVTDADIRAAQRAVFRAFDINGIMPSRAELTEPTLETLFSEAVINGGNTK